MAQKTKFDPLEAAKVTSETRAKDEASAAKVKWDTTDVPPAPPPKVEVAPVAEATVAPEALSTPPPVRAKRTVFEVVEAKQVSIGAMGVHRFKVGDRLDPAGYGGEAGVLRLGLNLKRVEI
jgi:hypothetical protein